MSTNISKAMKNREKRFKLIRNQKVFGLSTARVDNPGKSIGGPRSSTSSISGHFGGHNSFCGGHRWTIRGLRWSTGRPTMKGPQRLVTPVETAGKFYKHKHACTDHFR